MHLSVCQPGQYWARATAGLDLWLNQNQMPQRGRPVSVGDLHAGFPTAFFSGERKKLLLLFPSSAEFQCNDCQTRLATCPKAIGSAKIHSTEKTTGLGGAKRSSLAPQLPVTVSLNGLQGQALPHVSSFCRRHSLNGDS